MKLVMLRRAHDQLHLFLIFFEFPFWQSFINVSLMSICFAGLMINFIAAFILSLMKKWLAKGQVSNTLATHWQHISNTLATH
jgi:hypothetical protein